MSLSFSAFAAALMEAEAQGLASPAARFHYAMAKAGAYDEEDVPLYAYALRTTDTNEYLRRSSMHTGALTHEADGSLVLYSKEATAKSVATQHNRRRERMRKPAGLSGEPPYVVEVVRFRLVEEP